MIISNDNIYEVINVLNENGKVVAIKTDTVYGLICSADDSAAISKIYEIKKRDIDKPISLFIKNKYELTKYVNFYKNNTNDDISNFIFCEDKTINNRINNLINNYWPGNLTIIFNKIVGMYDTLTKGKNTIAIRIPNDDFLLSILNNIDFPLAQTSANLQGEKPYTDATMINKHLGNVVDLIVDGGPIFNNVPSTIIDISNNSFNILRKGKDFEKYKY